MKNLSKNTKSSLTTYGMVVAAYIICELFLQTGHMTSLLKGLLVPLCVYAILAVSLNLTVGILGELSLGHAGFMCVGAFTSAVFSKCAMNTITVPTDAFPSGTAGRSRLCRYLWCTDWYSGTSSERRLSGHRNPGIW